MKYTKNGSPGYSEPFFVYFIFGELNEEHEYKNNFQLICNLDRCRV